MNDFAKVLLYTYKENHVKDVKNTTNETNATTFGFTRLLWCSHGHIQCTMFCGEYKAYSVKEMFIFLRFRVLTSDWNGR